MEWNEESIARLRGLWAEGHSTAEIGRRLAVSKNAVVGKAHRLGLAARPSPIRRDGVAAPRGLPPRRVIGPTLPPLPASDAPAGPVAEHDPPFAAAPASRDAAPQLVPEAAPRSLPAVLAATHLAQAAAPAVSVPPAPQPSAVPSAPPPAVRPVPPARLSRSVACCWPIGEPGTKSFRFCDEDALQGKPYCADHAQLAYVKVRDRREEAA